MQEGKQVIEAIELKKCAKMCVGVSQMVAQKMAIRKYRKAQQVVANNY